MARPSRSAERAGLLFVLYAQLGPDRSLERLANLLASAGSPVPHGTLKRYSREYGWQRALLEAHAEAAAQRHVRAAEAIVAQAERHAQLGRVFQTLAARAADARLRDPEGLARASLAAIARAEAAGAEIERRAQSEQHDRQGIAVEIWNRLTVELVPAFVEFNALPDEQDRLERFVEHLDQLVDAHLRSVIDGMPP
jgi:hypothetical protein